VIFELFSSSLAFLDEHAKEMLNKKGGQWSPLITYRNGLAGQDEEDEGMEKENIRVLVKIQMYKLSVPSSTSCIFS